MEEQVQQQERRWSSVSLSSASGGHGRLAPSSGVCAQRARPPRRL